MRQRVLNIVPSEWGRFPTRQERVANAMSETSPADHDSVAIGLASSNRINYSD